MGAKIAAVILAAGVGSRTGLKVTKQKLTLKGQSVLKRSLRAFDECDMIDSITVVTREDEVAFAMEESSGISKLYRIVVGGGVRAESARIGFENIPSGSELVAIHDAARCLITPEMIKKVAVAAEEYGAASAAAAMTDTVKLVGEGGFVESTLDRSRLMRASTPQIFSTELYKRALDSVTLDERVTDDNSLIEAIGERVFLVNTGNDNIKITERLDISAALGILNEREGEDGGMIRIGHGYDVHRFSPERRLILGGVDLPYEKGLLGHSDADVLTHAIMDAMLGALALGDIGKHFPDTDEKYRGISSIRLLTLVNSLIREQGYRVSNLDATLILQAPKIAPFIDKMRENIAFAVGVDKSLVSIKATTEEHLGFTGSGDGAAAHAVVLLTKE